MKKFEKSFKKLGLFSFFEIYIIDKINKNKETKTNFNF